MAEGVHEAMPLRDILKFIRTVSLSPGTLVLEENKLAKTFTQNP